MALCGCRRSSESAWCMPGTLCMATGLASLPSHRLCPMTSELLLPHSRQVHSTVPCAYMAPTPSGPHPFPPSIGGFCLAGTAVIKMVDSIWLLAKKKECTEVWSGAKGKEAADYCQKHGNECLM